MRRMTAVSLWLTVVFATSLAAAALASASAPEFGTCKPAVAGAFKNADCTILSTTNPASQKYEWYSAFGSTMPIAETFISQTGKAITLQVGTSIKVTCTTQFSEAERLGNTTITYSEMGFDGCQAHVAGQASPCDEVVGGQSGFIQTNELVGELGVIETEMGPPTTPPGRKDKIGVDLSPRAQPFFRAFTCGPAGWTFGLMTFKVTGSVIAKVPANKMQLVSEEHFTASGDTQIPEKFEDPAPIDVLSTSVNSGTPVKTALKLKTEDENFEEIETSSVN